MQYLDLQTQLRDFSVFSIKDIEKVDVSFHKQRLSEWQNKGYIKKLRQGFYMFSDFDINEPALFTLANKLYEPSYVSLEMALSIYGLIPEAVYGVTSATSQITKAIKTPVGSFIYRHLQPELMFGYDIKEYNGHHYQIAEIEKAILDYLYVNPRLNNEESFKSIRFNVQQFKDKVDLEKFSKYSSAFNNKSFFRRVKKFLTFINKKE